MCTGAEIGLILAAAGTAGNTLNQQAAARKQDQIAAQGLRQQSDLRRQSTGRAMEQVEDFAGSAGQDERAQLAEAYRTALRNAQPGADASFGAVGAANPRYAEDVAARQTGLLGELGQRAGNLSTIDAANLQRQREGQRMGRTASDLAQFADRSQAVDYLTRLRTAAAQPNPWVGGISQLMQGVGSAMAMMPAAGAASTAGAPVTAAAASPAGMTADTLKLFKSPYMGSPANMPGFWP